MLGRPKSNPDSAGSLLSAEHFQVAYATNDIDRACALFRKRYGARRFARLEGPTAAGGHIRVELAWIGGVMVELMTSSGEGSAIYVDRLPQGPGFALKLHHLGYLIDGEPQWEALMATVATDGHRLAHLSNSAGFMRSCFVDAPELGHYLEYIWPEPAGRAFLESVPGN